MIPICAVNYFVVVKIIFSYIFFFILCPFICVCADVTWFSPKLIEKLLYMQYHHAYTYILLINDNRYCTHLTRFHIRYCVWVISGNLTTHRKIIRNNFPSVEKYIIKYTLFDAHIYTKFICYLCFIIIIKNIRHPIF